MSSDPDVARAMVDNFKDTYNEIRDDLLLGWSSYVTSRTRIMADIAAAEHYYTTRNNSTEVSLNGNAVLADFAAKSGITGKRRLASSLLFVDELAARVSDGHASQEETILRAVVIIRGRLHGCGYPTFNVGHKLAAALAVTKPSFPSAVSMRLPFEAFTVNLPDGLFVYPDGTEIKSVEVNRYEDAKKVARLWVNLLTSSSHCCHLTGESMPSLLSILNRSKDALRVRCETAALNAALNLATMLCDESTMKPVGSSHASWAKYGKHRAGKEPTRRVFQVAHDIQHDFRNDLRQYTSGNGHKLTVQFMVRGHWRRQVHGPARALRRLQFIEPFWKGDVAAPIALRAHVIDAQEPS